MARMKRELRVWGWDPVDRVWRIHYTTDDIHKACSYAAALRKKGLRIKVVPHKTPILQVKPQVVSETRRFREQQAGQMIELADAKKRYKSPG